MHLVNQDEETWELGTGSRPSPAAGILLRRLTKGHSSSAGPTVAEGGHWNAGQEPGQPLLVRLCICVLFLGSLRSPQMRKTPLSQLTCPVTLLDTPAAGAGATRGRFGGIQCQAQCPCFISKDGTLTRCR